MRVTEKEVKLLTLVLIAAAAGVGGAANYLRGGWGVLSHDLLKYNVTLVRLFEPTHSCSLLFESRNVSLRLWDNFVQHSVAR